MAIEESLSQDTHREQCTRFAHWNWVSMAGAAYRHFMKQGRGALLMDLKSLKAWENGQAFSLEVDYVTYFEEERAQSLLESYDPERQIVLFLTSNSKAVNDAAQRGGPVRLDIGDEISVWIIDPPTPKEITA